MTIRIIPGWKVVSPVRADHGGHRHRSGGADGTAGKITHPTFYGIVLIIVENKSNMESLQITSE